ncbi:IS3 family transposase [Bacillota bacterium LCP21S3_F9]
MRYQQIQHLQQWKTCFRYRAGCKEIIDYLHTDHPTWGARQMAAQLKQRGYHIGRKKARRWMTEMAIDPIYPKPNLSKCLQRAAVVPYLLRNADITRLNQAWSIDITYIPVVDCLD